MQGREEGFGNVICVTDEENENLSWKKRRDGEREETGGTGCRASLSEEERIVELFSRVSCQARKCTATEQKGEGGGAPKRVREREKREEENEIKGRGICCMNERKKETACGGNASESARITE